MGLAVHKYRINVLTKDFADDFDEYRKAKGKGRLVKNRRANTRRMMEILSSINQKIMDEIIFRNYKFRLPYQIGTLSIILNETPAAKNRLRIDWNRTKKMWAEKPETKEQHKMVYFLNEHSDGKYVQYMFQKHHRCSMNMKLYSFIPTAGNKRKLAQAMRDDKVETLAYVNKMKSI